MASTATATVIWAPPVVRRAVVAVEPTCACGQALEWSHQAHCPRCGVTLHA